MRIHRSENWVFQFLVGVDEASCNIVNQHIYEQDMMDEVTYCWEFSEELINTIYLKLNKSYISKLCAVVGKLDENHTLVLPKI